MALPVYPSLSFRLLGSAVTQPPFSPRLGSICLTRPTTSSVPPTTIEMPTPGMLTGTSRGTVPHLSRDHVKKTAPIDWVHVPFETFLEHTPPVPTLQQGPNPLHKFLGFSPSRHIISMSLRDPSDGREITPNGKDSVSALCVRGVRKVSPEAYNSYVSGIQADIAVALSDTPFTPPPHSEKRIIKSLERSLSWLATILRLTPPSSANPPNIFVHMAGGVSDVARDDFATGLLEPLDGPEARALKPLGLQTLDDGVSGYVFDLVPLHTALVATTPHGKVMNNDVIDAMIPLIQTSLTPLPPAKPRLATSAASPHQILKLVQSGVDLFDAHFAQKAADWGVALDFQFPISGPLRNTSSPVDEIGHNLYDEKYAMDFEGLSSKFPGASLSAELAAGRPSCPCIACSPSFSDAPLSHCSLDSIPQSNNPSDSLQYAPPFTRAYVHHLLHTHEMSAHALLAAHNITILSAFFSGIRGLLEDDPASFTGEAQLFMERYERPDSEEGIFGKAKTAFHAVDLARGKGRLAREKADREAAESNSTQEITA